MRRWTIVHKGSIWYSLMTTIVRLSDYGMVLQRNTAGETGRASRRLVLYALSLPLSLLSSHGGGSRCRVLHAVSHQLGEVRTLRDVQRRHGEHRAVLEMLHSHRRPAGLRIHIGIVDLADVG